MTEPTDNLTVYQDPDGNWRWTLRAAGNHEIIAASTESYARKSAAVENLERVTGHAVDQWKESLG